MSLELTENKSIIGSGALNDLVFILYCRVKTQWLPTNRQSVGNQLGSDRQLIGDRSTTVSSAFVFDCRKSATFFRLVGNRSATGRRLKTVSGLSTNAATGRQPVGNHQKPFYDRFGRREVLLAATETSLRPNRPCNLLQPVGDQSPTSLQPPCNLPATTRNFGRKEVADRLQAICDRGFIQVAHSGEEHMQVYSFIVFSVLWFRFTSALLSSSSILIMKIAVFFHLIYFFLEYSVVCYMPHFSVYFRAFLEDVFLGFHFSVAVSALGVLFASIFEVVFLLATWMPLPWGWRCTVFWWDSPCIVVFWPFWYPFSSLASVWS